jgi:FAD-dependent urate hydroxylase
MGDTRTALVIGGGIAGPVTAMALRKAGIEATVYEAYATTADTVGGGLGIAPNGMNALAVLDVAQAVERVGEPMDGMVIQSWTGKRLAEFTSPPSLPAMQFVWRADLYRALLDEALTRGVPVEYGKRIVSATTTAEGVTARFADGTAATADVLVGCDGIRSTVRGLLDPGAPKPRYAGMLNFGAFMRETGEPPTRNKMYMVFGKRAFFGYQVFDDGTGGWFVNLPHERMTFAETRAVPVEHWRKLLGEAFADDRVPAAAMIGRTDPADLLVVGPMEDIPTVRVWSGDRIVLVGDSAHPTSPSSGQGASIAVESAVQLARCLRDLPRGQAFTAYEQLRRKRVEAIIQRGARTNQGKAAGPVGRVVRDAMMPVAARLLAKAGLMTREYEYTIDWDQPVGPPA